VELDLGDAQLLHDGQESGATPTVTYKPGIHNASYSSAEESEEWRWRNNLSFVSEPGYNYNRPRQPVVGNDW
jgi:hypothetical protein